LEGGEGVDGTRLGRELYGGGSKQTCKESGTGGPVLQVSMKIVAWNYRGLGNRPTVRGLLELQKSEGADILFLLETKLDKRRLEKFRWMLGLTNMLVRSRKRMEGIAVFWRRGIDVSLQGMSQHYIDVDVKGGWISLEIHEGVWRVTK
jgi:exonuclease III